MKPSAKQALRNTDEANEQFDAIVVGSGLGGATLANELTKRGQKVVVLEWGGNEPLKGTFAQMAKIAGIPGKGAFLNSDLSLLLRGITAGGSSAINFAGSITPPLAYFDKYGVDLREEIDEIRQMLPLEKLPDNLIGPMAHKIMHAARDLDLKWEKLDKFIYMDKCRTECDKCSYGCPYDAKWNARMFLDEAVLLGAELKTKAKVTRVVFENDRALGVEYIQYGKKHILHAKKTIISAGGIGSPRILQASGIEQAGKDYFVDPVIAVMGSVKGIKAGREVPMAAGLHLPEEGIMLSDLTLPRPLFQAFTAQVGRFDRLLSHSNTLTIMVKIKDELSGSIGAKWLNKKLSLADKEKLEKGCLIAEKILKQAGATSIFRSHHFAAHPGGGVKIGDLVDSNLKSDFDDLYVCDSSVIPEAWGLPPSYTLMCLALRLAKHLNQLP